MTPEEFWKRYPLPTIRQRIDQIEQHPLPEDHPRRQFEIECLKKLKRALTEKKKKET